MAVINHLSDDIRTLDYDHKGPIFNPAEEVLDIVGETYGTNVACVTIPRQRLPAEFFDLSTRIAGEFMQKLVNYHVTVAIVGNIDEYLNASSTLQAFVHESNRGSTLWFVEDRDAVHDRLNPATGS